MKAYYPEVLFTSENIADIFDEFEWPVPLEVQYNNGRVLLNFSGVYLELVIHKCQDVHIKLLRFDELPPYNFLTYFFATKLDDENKYGLEEVENFSIEDLNDARLVVRNICKILQFEFLSLIRNGVHGVYEFNKPGYKDYLTLHMLQEVVQEYEWPEPVEIISKGVYFNLKFKHTTVTINPNVHGKVCARISEYKSERTTLILDTLLFFKGIDVEKLGLVPLTYEFPNYRDTLYSLKNQCKLLTTYCGQLILGNDDAWVDDYFKAYEDGRMDAIIMEYACEEE